MPQLIYSIAAIFVLGIAFLNVNQKVHGTEDRMMFSEITLEMTSVGAEILDEMGKRPFDANTVSGLIIPASALGPTASVTPSLCDPNDSDYANCDTIGHFHGKTATRNRTRTHSGTAYTVPYNVTSIAVQYVSETAPHTVSGTPTFAKEATIRIETPVLVDASGNPFGFEMRRVYTYPDL